MKIRNIFTLMLLTAFFFNCSLTKDLDYSKQDVSGKIDPEQMIPLNPDNNSDLFHNFVGYGYNALTKQPAHGVAIDNDKVNLYTDNRVVSISYKYIENLSDFETFLSVGVDTGLDAVFGPVKLNASLGASVANKLQTSSRNVYVVVRVTYCFGSVILSDGKMNMPAATLWSDRELFTKKYGNTYIAQNLIGDTFYYIYHYKVNSKSTYNMVAVKTAIDMKIGSIFGFHVNTDVSNSTTISNMKIDETIDYVANGYIPTIFPKTRDDVNTMLLDFASQMKAKYEQRALTGDWTSANSLGVVLGSYEDLMKEQASVIDVYYLRMLAWYKILYKLVNVQNTLNSSDIYVQEPDKTQLLNDINPAVEYCQSQVLLCQQEKPGDYPPANLYNDLINCTSPVLLTPRDYKVQSPGRFSFTWTQKPYLTSYEVFLDEKPIGKNQSSTFSCDITAPGEHIWFVRGYDLQNNFCDSISTAFNIPGFDAGACPADQSALAPSNYTLYFTPNKGNKSDNSDVFYNLTVNGQNVYSGNNVWASNVNISEPTNVLVVSTTINGVTAYSAPLTLYSAISGPSIINWSSNASTVNSDILIQLNTIPGAIAYKVTVEKDGSLLAPVSVTSDTPAVHVSLAQGCGTYTVTAHALGYNLQGSPTSINITLQPNVTTFSGSGATGNSDGTSVGASFNNPTGIVRDSQGNLFVVDQSGLRIRKIDTEGNVMTFAGSVIGTNNGTGTNAQFNGISAITIDPDDNLFVADFGRIRKITPNGAVTSIAGRSWYNTAILRYYKDGNGTNAMFGASINGLAADKLGNIYVSDTSNSAIRKITPTYDVMTVAGSYSNNLVSSVWYNYPVPGFSDGQGTSAKFNNPSAIVIDSTGNLFVSDNFNVIRKLSPYYEVTTCATTFNQLASMTIDSSDSIFATDYTIGKIKKMDVNGEVSIINSVSGTGYADGLASNAKFYYPIGITTDPSGINLFVVDNGNKRIRKITQ